MKGLPDPDHAYGLWRTLLIPALALIVAGGYAHAQETVCGPGPEVEAVVASEFAAHPLFDLTNSHGTSFVMMVNPDNGYWVMFSERGPMLCFIAEGNDFRPHVDRAPRGEPM